MASSTSFEQSHGSSSIRARPGDSRRFLQGPDTTLPRSLITAQYSAVIKDETLKSLARKLYELDTTPIKYTKQIFGAIVSGRLNKGDTEAQNMALEAIQDIAAIDRQFVQIQDGRQAFGEDYLKDTNIIFYWSKAFSFMSQLLGDYPDDAYATAVVVSLGELATRLAQLEELLLNAAADGVLHPDILASVGERWSRVERMGMFYSDRVDALKTLPRWDNVSRLILKATPKGDDTAPTNRRAPPPKLRNLSVILWLTFLITAVCNVWTFAIGYSCSTHEAGTTRDDDFWFLLQSCISQFFGIGFMVIPLLSIPQARRRVWLLPTVAAMVSTSLAVPFYLYVPKEWGTFCMLVGSSVQTFLGLQLAVVNYM